MINSSIKLTDKKSYNQITSLVLEKQKNKIITIYKLVSLLLFFITLGLFLFLINYALFYEQTLLLIAFNFSTDAFQEANWGFIFRLAILGFLYLYGFKKAYLNIYQNKTHIKLYSIWFSLYLLTSLSGFILFFTYKHTNVNQVFYLLYSLIPLLLIDISYVIFSFYTKRKTNPLIYANKKLLIIDLLSRVSLVAITFLFFGLWISASIETSSMIINNSFYDSIYKIFKFKGFLNFLIIIASFLVLVLLLIGLKIYTIFAIIYKQIDTTNLKNKFDYYLTGLAVIILWLISLAPIKIEPTHTRFTTDDKFDYLNLLFSLFNVVILIAFVYLQYFKKHKLITNKLVVNNYLISYLWIIWVVFMISNFLTDQVQVSLINLIINIVLTIISFALHYHKNKFSSFSNGLLIVINLQILFIVGLIYGLNHILLSNHNKSLYILDTRLTINQIISIVIVLVQTSYYLYYLINSVISINQIKKIEI
ncbi:MSC_0624 family F1-like ATPase-associated membrane protein [Mycoplasma putrefaciens]|uniref:Transmembrane protein n=1 Tax=Mycoplasma putrefaciens Mput9231 TaxID=1292033 RepID=M9WDF0_9MOLU|nr:hypothetical protein [Mycoplasma putrefaciens]AGJ90821.1 Hypothetical protein, predicted transmembrane protein [Mycoplasma putrefaciens Mput9231]